MLDAAAQQLNDYESSSGQQTHDMPGLSFSQRIINHYGSSVTALGENTYTYVPANDVVFAHAGFNVDWGVSDKDHRANIMNIGIPLYQEVGVAFGPMSYSGKVNGVPFGPYGVTQSFAGPSPAITAIVGVVYIDSNRDGQFQPNEGVGNLPIVFKNTQNTNIPKMVVYSFPSGYYRADLPAGVYKVNFKSVGSVVFSTAITGINLPQGTVISKDCYAGGVPYASLNTNDTVDLDDDYAYYNYNDTNSANVDGNSTTVFDASGLNYTATNQTDFALIGTAAVDQVSAAVSQFGASFVIAAIMLIVASLI